MFKSRSFVTDHESQFPQNWQTGGDYLTALAIPGQRLTIVCGGTQKRIPEV